MALMRGKLFAGALFAGLLLGGQQSKVEAAVPVGSADSGGSIWLTHVSPFQLVPAERLLPEGVTKGVYNGTINVPPAGSPSLGEAVPASLDTWRSAAASVPVYDAGIQLTMATNAAALVSGDTADRRTALDAALAQARDDDDMAMILILMGME